MSGSSGNPELLVFVAVAVFPRPGVRKFGKDARSLLIMVVIHPTAMVHPDARIHPDAVVGPMCHIGAHARIGRGTRLVSHVWVEERTVTGDDNMVYPFAGLGGAAQTRAPEGAVQAPLVIGDRDRIRESATIHRGSTESSGTRIGDDCLVMTCAHIAHDCVIGNSVVVTTGTSVAGHCHVGDFANISAHVIVTQHRHIGAHAFIAAAAKVDRDVPRTRSRRETTRCASAESTSWACGAEDFPRTPCTTSPPPSGHGPPAPTSRGNNAWNR
nr:hypothetical protein [Streptomyces niveus]